MSLVKKISALVGTMIGSFLLFYPSAFAQTVAAADTDFTVRNTSPLQPASVLLLPQLAVQWLRVSCYRYHGRVARNPGASGKMFVPMILGLALIESLVIYSLVISFTLVGKL